MWFFKVPPANYSKTVVTFWEECFDAPILNYLYFSLLIYSELWCPIERVLRFDGINVLFSVCISMRPSSFGKLSVTQAKIKRGNIWTKRIICCEVCGIIFRYNPEIFFQGLRITTKQASAAKYMSTALFWAITLLAMAIRYRRFGRTYRFHLYGSIIITMGP
jgi:hypothetical protein